MIYASLILNALLIALAAGLWRVARKARRPRTVKASDYRGDVKAIRPVVGWTGTGIKVLDEHSGLPLVFEGVVSSEWRAALGPSGANLELALGQVEVVELNRGD